MNDNQLRCWLSQARFHVSEPVETDINRPLANSITPLMYAAQTGDLDAIRSLLKRGADPALLNTDGNGALWFACFSNSEECVAELIKAGAPLDTQNVNGATALIYCASASKAPLVKLLLEAGANTKLKTHDDFTALELAADLECLRLLKDAKKTEYA
ncbi:MAG: ankyrin repeat domain-containing protein [Pseudomonadota bacterium]